MKRIIMLFLALVMMASFVACNEGGEVTTAAPETTASPVVTDAPDAETTAAETEPAFTGYKVSVTDKDGNPIAGVMIQMCDSVGCRMPKATDANGVVTFDFETSDFHVLIASPVDGYVVDTALEYWFENGGKELTIVLEKAA